MKKNIIPFLYFFACFAVLFTVPAHAYLDPTLTTSFIQVIAAIAVAVGATAGIYFRRAKKKVQDKLGIDENANKEVESEVEEFDSEEKN